LFGRLNYCSTVSQDSQMYTHVLKCKKN
jgi:hypothetical protein